MKRSIGKKWIACMIMVVMVIIVVPVSGNSLPQEQSSKDTTAEDWINITINGTNGENGWYTSNVTITITWDFPGETVYYEIIYATKSQNWTEYTEPITVEGDGLYNILTKVVLEGIVVFPDPYGFGIDTTPPVIYDFQCAKSNIFTWKCNVSTFDLISGINRAELYFSSRFYGNLTHDSTDDSYVVYFTVFHMLFMQVKAIFHHEPRWSFFPQFIVYDNAGNSIVSEGISYITQMGIYCTIQGLARIIIQSHAEP